MLAKGRIIGFEGSWSSGLGYLIVKNSKTKAVERVPCDNTQTVRALDAAFGDVITDAHTVNNDAIRGQDIYYYTDGVGLLEAFTPVGEATPQLVKEYQKQFKERKKKDLKKLT